MLGQMLNIFTQAAAAVDPGNCPLDDPAARLHLKADLFDRACDNLDCDTGPFDQVAR